MTIPIQPFANASAPVTASRAAGRCVASLRLRRARSPAGA